MFNPGKDVYSVQYKYGLFLFENPKHNVQEYLNLDKFLLLMRQNFDEDKVNVIRNTLEDNERLLIDFKTHKVSLVKLKKENFENIVMQAYFNKNNICQNYEENGGSFNEQSKYIW